MKLYTEEQMIQAYDAGWQDFKEGLIGRSYHVVDNITSIELPSDEDIAKGLRNEEMHSYAAFEGAIWMKEQIINQNK